MTDYLAEAKERYTAGQYEVAAVAATIALAEQIARGVDADMAEIVAHP